MPGSAEVARWQQQKRLETIEDVLMTGQGCDKGRRRSITNEELAKGRLTSLLAERFHSIDDEEITLLTFSSSVRDRELPNNLNW